MEIVKYNELEENILTEYYKGKSKRDIALALDIPEIVVKQTFYKPKIREKLQEIVEARELILKEKQLGYLESLTDEMLDGVEDDNFKGAIRADRDILDVIAITDKINKEQERKRLGTGQDNIVINILNSLSGDD